MTAKMIAAIVILQQAYRPTKEQGAQSASVIEDGPAAI